MQMPHWWNYGVCSCSFVNRYNHQVNALARGRRHIGPAAFTRNMASSSACFVPIKFSMTCKFKCTWCNVHALESCPMEKSWSRRQKRLKSPPFSCCRARGRLSSASIWIERGEAGVFSSVGTPSWGRDIGTPHCYAPMRDGGDPADCDSLHVHIFLLRIDVFGYFCFPLTQSFYRCHLRPACSSALPEATLGKKPAPLVIKKTGTRWWSGFPSVVLKFGRTCRSCFVE